jgi:hypothetical protein
VTLNCAARTGSCTGTATALGPEHSGLGVKKTENKQTTKTNAGTCKTQSLRALYQNMPFAQASQDV